jgi:uncharacterized protein YkwD
MPSPGSVPPSPGRLIAILVIACLVPLGVGALVDVASGDGTLVMSWAGSRGPVGGAPAGDATDGEGDGVEQATPGATGGGSSRPYDFGSTSAAVGRPSTTTTAAVTTTSDTQPSSTRAPSPTTAPPRDPTTTTPPAPAPALTESVIELTNAARGKAGCPALAADERLDAAAQVHSDDMVARDYFAHTSPDGTTFVDRARAAGYPLPGGENIARGPRSPAEVVSGWMDSPGHRANILNCEFTAIGVGLHEGAWVWTQVFGF